MSKISKVTSFYGFAGASLILVGTAMATFDPEAMLRFLGVVLVVCGSFFISSGAYHG